MRQPARTNRPLPATLLLAAVALLLALALGPASAAASAVNLSDGTYHVAVTVTGEDNATVASPTQLFVRDGKAEAIITWSSPDYDYMVVDGETYHQTNTEGNSTFRIPVAVFDEPIAVAADYTGFAVPRKLDYQLTFESASVVSMVEQSYAVPIFSFIVVCIVIWLAPRRLRPKDRKPGQPGQTRQSRREAKREARRAKRAARK